MIPWLMIGHGFELGMNCMGRAAPPPPVAPVVASVSPPPAKVRYTVEVIRGNKRADEAID